MSQIGESHNSLFLSYVLCESPKQEPSPTGFNNKGNLQPHIMRVWASGMAASRCSADALRNLSCSISLPGFFSVDIIPF